MEDLASDSLDEEYYCYNCMIWLSDLINLLLNEELFVVTLCNLCAAITDHKALATVS